VRSLPFARPVIDLRALAIRNFSLGWWVSFVTGIGIFTTVYLTPLFLGRVRGFNAQIGMAMLSAGAIERARSTEPALAGLVGVLQLRGLTGLPIPVMLKLVDWLMHKHG